MASSSYNQVSPLPQIRQQQQVRVVNVLLVGRSAVGKTTIARRLCLNNSIAENTVYRRTERLEIVSGDQCVDGITFHLNVVDTPGIDTYNESDLQQHFGSCFDRNITELDVIVYVSEAGKTNLLDLDLFKQIQTFFGERYNQMSTMVLTNSENFASQKLQQFVEDLRSHQDSSHFVNSLGIGVNFFGLVDGESMISKFPGQDIHSMMERTTQKVESWRNSLLSVILKQTTQKSLPLPIATKRINVLLIGKSRVGKTAVCRCLFGKNDKVSLQKTTANAFNSGTLISDKVTYQLNVIDTPGTDSFDIESFNKTLRFCKAKGIHFINIILYVTNTWKNDSKKKHQRKHADHFLEFQHFLGPSFNAISALVLTKCDKYAKFEIDKHMEKMRSRDAKFVETLGHGIVEFGWVEETSKDHLVGKWRDSLLKLVQDSASKGHVLLPQISSEAKAGTYGYLPGIDVEIASATPVPNQYPAGQQLQTEDAGANL